MRLQYLLLAFGCTGLFACGGGSGGSGSEDPTFEFDGVPVICKGTWQGPNGETIQYPCELSNGTCAPIPDEFIAGTFDCRPTPAEKELPGYSSGRYFQHGFCACAERKSNLPDQLGSCKEVCDEIAQRNLVVHGETGWSCGPSQPIENPLQPDGACVPGSIVYFFGGPSDYGSHIFGTQTTSGSKLGFSRSGSGNVDGLIDYSVGDRSAGCADGCEFQVTRLSLLIHPFSVPGVDAVILKWSGLSMNTSTFELQGMLDGVIYDDGSFELVPNGEQKAIVTYDGNMSGVVAKTLTQHITGRVNFETGSIELDSITYHDGDGKMVISKLEGVAHRVPPSAVISTPEVIECESPSGTDVALDASASFDRDGQQMTFRWTVDGEAAGAGMVAPPHTLGLGAHDVKLEVRNSTMARSYATKNILIQDSTAPSWESPDDIDLTTCDAQVDEHRLIPPVVTDSCTGVASIDLYLVEANGESLAVPQLLDADAATLPKGEGTLMWVATDAAGNSSAVYQRFKLGAALVAEDHFEVRDRVKVLQANGEPAGLASLGPGTSQFGVESLVGEVHSVGPLFLQNFATIAGLGRSEDGITKQHGASIGLEEAHGIVDLVALPWLQEAPASFDGPDFQVLPDQILELPSAAHGIVRVYSRSTLIVPFQSTSIRELWIEPDATVVFEAAAPELFVGERWIHRGTLQGTGHLTIRVSGSEVQLERRVGGVSLVAPNAHVRVTTGANDSRFGLLVGRTVEFQPDVTLWCDRQSLL